MATTARSWENYSISPMLGCADNKEQWQNLRAFYLLSGTSSDELRVSYTNTFQFRTKELEDRQTK
jgi:hypothetical protein